MCLVQFTGLVSAFSIHGLQTVHHTGHVLTVILKELLRLVLVSFSLFSFSFLHCVNKNHISFPNPIFINSLKKFWVAHTVDLNSFF